MNSKIITSLILAVSFLISPNLGISENQDAADLERDFNEKVNLALRQAGHEMLILEDDCTSKIDPVFINENRFSLRLNRLNYEKLPAILDSSLKELGIDREYGVLVSACDSEEPKLGYHSRALNTNEVACVGRDMQNGCHNITISFSASDQSLAESKPIQGPLVLSVLLGFFATIFWKDKIFKNGTDHSGNMKLGKYLYNFQNQKLSSGPNQQDLTFRENKLLHLLVNHANQVVKRETILAEVWEDEGVMVGRSVDVFISRLRKYFSDDDSIEIKNVHGVGYRLNVFHLHN